MNQEQGAYVPKHLDKWTRPDAYIGAEWNGYYAAPCGQHRESDAIERSNWIVQLDTIPESEDGESVVVVRERHFLVGWCEWLAIREDAHDALRKADGIAEDLEVYPVLDEDHASELEAIEEMDRQAENGGSR